MNRKILLAEVLLALILVLGFRVVVEKDSIPKQISRSVVYQNRMIGFCSPDWSLINADSLAETIKPLPGWGTYSWPIKSAHDSAQFYFNQGINMYYAFHIIESMASFKKAETFDQLNPMIYWAEALAYGPNINDFAYAPSSEAMVMAKKAKELSSTASPEETALIDAMLLRYTDDTTISRTTLNTLYADAMEKAYQRFPGNIDIAALYADAMMLLHPWEYWKHNGDAHAWTPKILEVIEKALAHSPDHPGLNHYYIHATEASTNPGRALASADRLGKLMPGVAHMVHMPSHIYIRTGNYSKGVMVNEMSIKGYNNYLKLYPAVANNSPLYLIHNLHMQAACAMFQPNYSYSLKTARQCMKSFDTAFLSLPQPLGNFIQYVYMTPHIINVRYGKWEELIKEPEISSNYSYAHVLSLWSKGMAKANTGNFADAEGYLSRMKLAMKHPDLEVVLEPFNAPISASRVAEKLLEGMINEKSGRIVKAIDNYTDAVELEDKLIYSEPRDWLIPSRQYLANALIKRNEYKKAQAILEEDLIQNPLNFYSLSGLEKTLLKQDKKTEAKKVSEQLKAAYTNSDMKRIALIY